jgi:urease accessory protein
MTIRWPDRRFPAQAIALSLGLLPALGHAHATSESINHFYAGLLHPLITPEHVLAIIALGLLAGQQRAANNQSVAWTLVFALGLAMGALLAWFIGDAQVLQRSIVSLSTITLLNLVSVVLFGLMIAVAWPWPLLLMYPLVLTFGLTHGVANGIELTTDTAIYLFIPGLAAGTLVAALYCMALADFASRPRPYQWPRIALRVAGSWIAAIGILMLGMAWKSFSMT